MTESQQDVPHKPLPLDSRRLWTFVTLAHTGSFTRAARQLHLSQPAVSHAIRVLEEELKCRLFHRTDHNVYLSEAGEELLPHAEQALQALASARSAMKRREEWGVTRLRVGTPATAGAYILPQVIRELRRSYPKLAVGLHSADTKELIALLQANTIDIALAPVSGLATTVEQRPVFRDELLLTCPPTHPLASAKTIQRADLNQHQFLLTPAHTVTAGLVQRYFKQAGIIPTGSVEVGSIEAIKQMTLLDLGVAVLAPWTVEDELTRGRLKMRPLGQRALRRQWAVMYLPGRRLNLVEETFCSLCRKSASRLRKDRRDLRRRHV